MATITFIRADKQTLKLPLLWGVTPCDCGAGVFMTPVPMLDADDDDSLAEFSGDQHLMQTVQYLYAEAGMTRLFHSSTDRACGDDGCSWFIV